MIFYLGISVFLLVYAALSVDKTFNSSIYFRFIIKIFYFGFGCIFVCLGGFRWLTGTDWNAYYYYFVNNTTWQEFYNGKFEIAFSLLNFIVKFFSSDYTVYLLVLTFFCVFLKLKAIKNCAVYPGVCLLFYYCYTLGDMFAVRQSLSISILMYSVTFIRRKRKIAFFLATLLATAIHNTSVVWFIAYKVYWKNLNKQQIYTLFLICFVGGLAGGKFYPYLISVITAPLPASIRVVSKLLVYATGQSSSAFSFVTVLKLIKRAMFLPYFLYYKKKLRTDTTYNGLFNLWLTGTLIYLLFAGSLNVFQRMTAPFIFWEFCLFAYTLRFAKKQFLKPLYLLCLYFYGLSKMISTLNTYPDLYMPYYSVFSFQERKMY